MKRLFYTFLLLFFGVQLSDGVAAQTDLQKHWGKLASDQKMCGTSDLPADVYIGQAGVKLCDSSKNTTDQNRFLTECSESNSPVTWHALKNPAYSGDEYGILMLLATNVGENTLGFCPVFVVGQNEGRKDVWLSFKNAGTDCVQFYRNSPDGCVPRRIESARWSDVKPVSVTQRHDDVKYYEQKEDKCGKNLKQEHSMVMAITGWSPSGHGAYVQPITVRLMYVWKDRKIASYVRAYSAGTRELLCAAGYRLNNDKTDCVEIDSAACMMAADNWCSGYSATNYNSEIHTLVTDDTGCTRYTCNQTGYGFPSATDQSSCVPCDVTNARGGISPDRGVCVACDVGKYFNAKAKTTNYCSTAKPVSTLALLYGKDENSQKGLSDQCWTKTSASDYKNCVLGIATVLKKDLSSLKLFQPI